MRKIINAAKLVRHILEERPETRDDDHLLYLRVLEIVSDYDECMDIDSLSVSNFFLHFNDLHLPSYETISRARRKVQEKHPELRASEDVALARAELQKDFRAFALSQNETF